jgi:hypothetical protein
MRRMPLLARRLPVGFQHPVDMLFHRTQSRLFPYRLLLFRWDRAGDRLAHHSPVHAMLLRQSLDRLPGRVSAPDLFK